MARIRKKAEDGNTIPIKKVSLRTGQLKRLGKLSAKNPERAERVGKRIVERRSRLERGKEYLQKNVGKLYPEVPTIAKKGGSFPDLNKDGKITKADILKGRGVIKNGGKLKKAQDGKKVDTAVKYKKNPFGKMELEKKKKEAAFKLIRSLPKSKVGGRVSKMMSGGKCRGGCY